MMSSLRTPVAEAWRGPSHLLIGVGHLAFAMLTLFAGLFYLQRMIFVDPAYISFNVIGNGEYAVQVYRLGVVLTQSVPLLASKMGAPLQVVLFLYSITFPIFYWLLYSLLVHGLKAPRAGMVLLLGFTLIAYDSFYWVVAEFHQGMAMAIVLWAWLRRSFVLKASDDEIYWWEALLQLVFTAFILFYHPLIILPILFIYGYIWVQMNNRKSLWFFGMVILIMVIFYIKSSFFVNPYDDGKFEAFKAGLVEFYRNFNLGFFNVFLEYFLTDYWLWLIAFIAVQVHLVIQRKWLSFFYIGGGIGLYIFVICLTYAEESPKFYMDGLFFVLGFMLALPLVYDLLPSLSQQQSNVPLVVLVLILAIRLPMTFTHHQPYTQRLQCIDQLVEEMRSVPETNRFFVQEKDLPMDILIYDWALFYETALYSALQGPDAVQVAHPVPNKGTEGWRNIQKILNQKNGGFVFHEWGGLPSTKPSYQKYFHFNVQDVGYQLLEVELGDAGRWTRKISK